MFKHMFCKNRLIEHKIVIHLLRQGLWKNPLNSDLYDYKIYESKYKNIIIPSYLSKKYNAKIIREISPLVWHKLSLFANSDKTIDSYYIKWNDTFKWMCDDLWDFKKLSNKQFLSSDYFQKNNDDDMIYFYNIYISIRLLQ